MTMLATDFLQRLLPVALCLLVMSLYGGSEETGVVTFKNCRAVDVDTKFRLTNGPDEEFAVVFDMRNVAGHACVLDHGSYGANGSPTVPDRTDPWGKVFVPTADSKNRVWGTGKVAEQAVPILEPDKSAYLTIHWRTKPTKQNDPCIQPVAVNWPVLIVAPSLFKPLCSEIEVSSFGLDEVPPPDELKSETGQDSESKVLVLASERSVYHEGEEIRLHVSLATLDAAISVTKDTHPTVYLRQRSSDGTTEFRATDPLPHRGCQPGDSHMGITVRIFEEIDWKKGFDLDPDFCGSVIRPKRLGDYSFQVFKAIPSSGGAVRFVHSNVLHIQFENPAPPHRDSDGR
jgi:hypothetical protein